MSEQFGVFVEVKRGGATEKVQVGSATRDGDGFVLRLGEMTLGAPTAGASSGGGARASGGGGGGGGGEVFPNYGRSKGMPIKGASSQDLEFYLNGCKRTLADPGKSRFHDKEKQLMAAIQAEIARQGGGSGGGEDEPPPPGDEDAPF